MFFYRVVLTGIVFSGAALAADPFLGKWAVNKDKSTHLTWTLAVKDLGGDRYALSANSGETTTVTGDGNTVALPGGATVSFKQLSDRKWRMTRRIPAISAANVDSIYTVSADDKTMTAELVSTRADGSRGDLVITYSRTGAGHGLYGEWRSTSYVDKFSGEAKTIVIEPHGSNALSFLSPEQKGGFDVTFDGQWHPMRGPAYLQGALISGNRAGPRVLHFQQRQNGLVFMRAECRLSADGKTLTITEWPTYSAAVFTSVYERQ